MKKCWRWAVLTAAFLCLVGCESADESETNLVESLDPEYGKPLMDGGEVSLKDDSLNGAGGLPVSVDTGEMAVWDVQNQWEDVDTPAARAAGMSWGPESGTDWNEKYALWVQSMEAVQGETGKPTFQLLTPFGRSLPAPSLECAEVAIFLRAAFAAWYKLPFFMSAWTPEGRVYFGHFGIMRKTGRYNQMPNFKSQYADYSDMAPEEFFTSWPSDSALAGRYLTTKKDDVNVFLGEGRYSGAYFDAIFLNKRAGHFMIYLLTYLGSIHLASPTNTFNLKPESLGAGDVLLHRWQKQGVGHTLLVKSVDHLAGGQLSVEVASGNMPRRQPKWESAASSKYQFTKAKAGGPGISSDGYAFSALGGGLKRWRFPKVLDGEYYNVVGSADGASFIPSSSHVELAERVTTFGVILGELPPEETRDVLLSIIAEYRDHLVHYPASCSARTKREKAFEDLYLNQGTHFGMSRDAVDREYRVFEDYVFAELVYEESRTCCWNSSNAAMAEAIVEYAKSQTEMDGQCVAPPVFKMVDGGYGAFRIHAESVGVIWPEWSADESCPQAATVVTDTETVASMTEFCSVGIDWMTVLPGEEENVIGSGVDGGCSVSTSGGCGDCACEACVCALDSYCCGTAWDDVCVSKCQEDCGIECPEAD